MRTPFALTRSESAIVGIAAILAGVPGTLVSAQTPALSPVAAPWLSAIREEGLKRSQVMTIASLLTDVYGPRLTGSPWTKQAADWTVAQLTSWGVSNPHLEWWDFGGRGWNIERFSAQVLTPHAFPLIAYLQPWSAGTNGPVTGDVVALRLDSLPDFDRYRGKLRGKWVLIRPPRPTTLHLTPDAVRWSQVYLDSLELPLPPPTSRAPIRPPIDTAAERRSGQVRRATGRFLDSAQVLGILWEAPGDYGTVVQDGSSSRRPNAPQSAPQFWLAAEHYGRIWRMLEKDIPVTVEIDARVRFTDDAAGKSFNIVAELPGTDRRDEVVMLGAHVDSWAAGTGATDNAANCAVMLEAMRILKVARLPLRRTVRLTLWTGEEQGYLGSTAYAREHFGYVDSTGSHFTSDHAKVSVYFNLDGGGGAIRGVHLQGNTAAGPVFRDWFAAFGDPAPYTLSVRSVGGSDNVVFDALHIPSFAFIQDPLDYETRTHHTNMDLFERLQPADMIHNAITIAALAYQAANRADLLPRK